MSIAFDVDKFRKVRALAEAGSTVGERAAAKSRLEAMARKAGLSLKEAFLHDDPDKGSSKNSWTAEQMAAYWAEEVRKEKAHLRSAKQYCSCGTPMAESECERLRREAGLEILPDMDVERSLRVVKSRRSGRQRRPSPDQLDLFI
jgi:hypothetical protein